jgi:hypothetical protein
MTTPSPENDIACRRIVFLVSQLGYDGRLLYWEPILERLAVRLRGLRVLCGDAAAVANYPGLPFAPAFRRLQFSLPGVSAGQFRRIFSLPAPGVIRTVLQMRPEVLVLMEFGLTTLFGLAAARLLSGCAVLLLVESDPGPLEASLLGWRRRLRRFVCRQCDLVLTNNDKGRRYLE